MVIGFIFVLFFARNVEMLLASEILCGVLWGVFQTQITTYAAEVTPIALRAYITSYVNICWLMGQFIASGTLRGMINYNSEWAYRLPFALQWVWPVPIIVGVIFAPESPLWLVRKGWVDEAKKALLRFTSNKRKDFNVDHTAALMVHTNELEKQIASGTS
jgi:MFS transporter, SP family, general alpha glucoside:H+ symporter